MKEMNTSELGSDHILLAYNKRWEAPNVTPEILIPFSGHFRWGPTSCGGLLQGLAGSAAACELITAERCAESWHWCHLHSCHHVCGPASASGTGPALPVQHSCGRIPHACIHRCRPARLLMYRTPPCPLHRCFPNSFDNMTADVKNFSHAAIPWESRKAVRAARAGRPCSNDHMPTIAKVVPCCCAVHCQVLPHTLSLA
jgi:hypothetical protein